MTRPPPSSPLFPHTPLSRSGRQHPDTAKGLMNLAAFYHERGRESGAEELYRQAAAIFDAAYGPNHSLTLLTRSELADVLRDRKSTRLNSSHLVISYAVFCLK